MKLAKILRFYPGLTYSDLNSMGVDEVEELWLAIDVLEAQEILMKQKISIFPNLKNEVRNREHREIYKRAFPRDIYKPKTISIQELGGLING